MSKPAISVPDVHWAGEAQALEALGEKQAFVARLLALGYRPQEFRVTVRTLAREGSLDRRTRYNVVVDQMRNGQPYRGKSYLGGHPERWIDKFSVDSGTDFPRPSPSNP